MQFTAKVITRRPPWCVLCCVYWLGTCVGPHSKFTPGMPESVGDRLDVELFLLYDALRGNVLICRWSTPKVLHTLWNGPFVKVFGFDVCRVI